MAGQHPLPRPRGPTAQCWSQSALWLSGAPTLTVPYCPASPHLGSRKPRASDFLETSWGAEEATRCPEGGRTPQGVEGDHLLPPAGTLQLTSLTPSPPAGLAPTGGPFLVATEHLRTTLGRHSRPLLGPSEPPAPATVHGGQAGQRPSRSPLFPSGTKGLHSRPNPSDRQRVAEFGRLDGEGRTCG